MDGERKNCLAQCRDEIKDEGWILKDECGVFPEIRLVFGGGEVVERGADEAGVAFARGGLQ